MAVLTGPLFSFTAHGPFLGQLFLRTTRRGIFTTKPPRQRTMHPDRVLAARACIAGSATNFLDLPEPVIDNWVQLAQGQLLSAISLFNGSFVERSLSGLYPIYDPDDVAGGLIPGYAHTDPVIPGRTTAQVKCGNVGLATPWLVLLLHQPSLGTPYNPDRIRHVIPLDANYHQITGLEPNTTYHLQSWALNKSAQRSVSAHGRTFTTLP